MQHVLIRGAGSFFGWKRSENLY